MPYTLGQAAKATGKSKSTLQVAIKKGRVSATQAESGQYQIDPAELHRVYPPISSTDRTAEPQSEQNRTDRTAEKMAEIMGLQARLEVMEQIVSELRGDKEKAERREVEAARREAEIRRDLEQWRGFAFDAQQRLKALEAPRPDPLRGEVIETKEDAPEAAAQEPKAPKKGLFRWPFHR